MEQQNTTRRGILAASLALVGGTALATVPAMARAAVASSDPVLAISARRHEAEAAYVRAMVAAEEAYRFPMRPQQVLAQLNLEEYRQFEQWQAVEIEMTKIVATSGAGLIAQLELLGEFGDGGFEDLRSRHLLNSIIAGVRNLCGEAGA